ncbi:N-acetylmuramoyl-L-alanine amidase [Merismopedia glauca]|uniref:N-acetylmuramoyl-L-alanine amidase n=1 Tax=Merismopedia glauca CCAP 1448/3 TaxID=1296344 RepID=A0A2T1BZZ4_9CYAN|nr:N-acetylmuramoyl-L-alanine amidase [Merismopedia glauca]PSB01562.1 N-acetylmuramoyl-L-alanine amidase [Merismopedia glauca CCAP 1448/3]
MKKVLGLSLFSLLVMSPLQAAETPLAITFPPNNYQTTSDRIFIMGSAPSSGEVLINGQAISRSKAGYFAPSLPLKLGENRFQIRYNDKQTEIVIVRSISQNEEISPQGFVKNSLTPKVNIAKLPGEYLCFEALAPTNAQVAVQLGGKTIPLTYQPQVVELPDNKIALTQLSNQPQTVQNRGRYTGCAVASAPGDLGVPVFQITQGNRTLTEPGTGKIEILSPVKLEIAEVTVEGGIARTGPSTDNSRLTPLPKGTRAAVTGKEGDFLRLDYGGWINKSEVRLIPGATPPKSIIRSIRARQLPGVTEVLFPLQVPVPVTVQQGTNKLVLRLYNTTAQTDIIRLDDDPVIYRLDWQQISPGVVEYTFNLKQAQAWGYQLQYRGTSLALSLRHPPKRDRSSDKTLNGIKIVLDPGHGGQDSGALGPTGYTEKEVNLVMSKLIAQELQNRGALVYLTRTEDKAVALPDRVAYINSVQPAIALSIHHNSLPDGGDTMNIQGFGSFWYHPQAHDLALFLHQQVVRSAGRKAYGIYWDNLALARPTSAPSVLLELGFMSNPVEFEEKVTNPTEQKKLAKALADGVEKWFALQIPN